MEGHVKARDISSIPEVLQLAEEVDASQTPPLLTNGDRVVAILTPADSSAERLDPHQTVSRRRPDSLLNIIGIGESSGPSDVEQHELEYLAEAYEARHD